MSALHDVLTWWGAQLRDLVPQRLRSGWTEEDALIADIPPGAADLTFVHRHRGQEAVLGRLSTARLQAMLRGRRRPRLLLRVPAGSVLERSLQLPLATEPQLARVLGYEADRISPFAADEVAMAYSVDRRDRDAARLHLRVALLPRSLLAPALAALQAGGLVPAGVLAPREGGGTWSIGLALPGTAGPAAGRRPVQAAAIACAVLAAVAMVLPFVLQGMALDRAERRIAQLRPAVDQADALRRRVADRSSGLDAVAAEAARTGQALTVLATLTALLPDDTWLTALSLRQRVLTLSGRSASAARVIPLLAADPAVRDAAFTAPVTRAEEGGDVFSIRAEFGS